MWPQAIGMSIYDKYFCVYRESFLLMFWLLDVYVNCRGRKEYTLTYFLKYAAAVKEKASSLSTKGWSPQVTMHLEAPRPEAGVIAHSFIHISQLCSHVGELQGGLLCCLTGGKGCNEQYG